MALQVNLQMTESLEDPWNRVRDKAGIGPLWKKNERDCISPVIDKLPDRGVPHLTPSDRWDPASPRLSKRISRSDSTEYSEAFCENDKKKKLVSEDQALGLCDCLLLREHLADLHEGLVLGLWDDEIDVDGHGKTNAAEQQGVNAARSSRISGYRSIHHGVLIYQPSLTDRDWSQFLPTPMNTPASLNDGQDSPKRTVGFPMKGNPLTLTGPKLTLERYSFKHGASDQAAVPDVLVLTLSQSS
ncbi:hypothetical protein EYF80_041215 [Liparis tanakae]|uniref:Uncharacterized protein n=1 Tax=Liparis tanakae TaxID=230148 RepID=A0A4Z2G4V2_9TELE|nr:hypothetical protein EYF80_041215 [Liparis tanakae]